MKITKRKLRWIATVAIALGFTLVLTQAWAADGSKKHDYALIFGTVWNGQRPVGGVKVKIRRAEKKKAQWTLLSDRRGEFAQRLPVGAAEYVVWAEVKGHKGPVGETRVRIEGNERADISLHLK